MAFGREHDKEEVGYTALGLVVPSNSGRRYAQEYTRSVEEDGGRACWMDGVDGRVGIERQN